MYNFRGLLGILRMDKVPNARIRDLFEGILRWFDHIGKMENDRIAKRVGEMDLGSELGSRESILSTAEGSRESKYIETGAKSKAQP